MGSPKSEVGNNVDERQVEVTLSRGFWTGEMYALNAWGIDDVHGNVREFTTTPGRARGGSWCDSGRNCCSAIYIPESADPRDSVGFRMVLVSMQ